MQGYLGDRVKQKGAKQMPTSTTMAGAGGRPRSQECANAAPRTKQGVCDEHRGTRHERVAATPRSRFSAATCRRDSSRLTTLAGTLVRRKEDDPQIFCAPDRLQAELRPYLVGSLAVLNRLPGLHKLGRRFGIETVLRLAHATLDDAEQVAAFMDGFANVANVRKLRRRGVYADRAQFYDAAYCGLEAYHAALAGAEALRGRAMRDSHRRELIELFASAADHITDLLNPLAIDLVAAKTPHLSGRDILETAYSGLSASERNERQLSQQCCGDVAAQADEQQFHDAAQSLAELPDAALAKDADESGVDVTTVLPSIRGNDQEDPPLELTVDEWDRVLRGTTVMRVTRDINPRCGKKGTGWIVFPVSCTPNEAWRIIRDHEKYPSRIPFVKSCTAYEPGDPTQEGLTWKIGIGCMNNTFHVLQTASEAHRRVSWTLDPTREHGHISVSDGSWEVLPHSNRDDRCMVKYKITVGVTGPAQMLVGFLLNDGLRAATQWVSKAAQDACR